MTKVLHALAATLLLSGPAYAQWNGGVPQTGAATYCASRSNGNSHARAESDAKNVMLMSIGGNTSDMIVTAAVSGGQMFKAAGYLAKQMCPQYFQTVATDWINNPQSYGSDLSAPTSELLYGNVKF